MNVFFRKIKIKDKRRYEIFYHNKNFKQKKFRKFILD